MERRFIFWSLPHRAYVVGPLFLLLVGYASWIARGATIQDAPIFIAFGWAAILLYVALTRVTLEVRGAGLRLARFVGQRWVPLGAVRNTALAGRSLRVELVSGELIEIRGDHFVTRTLAAKDDRFSVIEAHRALSAALGRVTEAGCAPYSSDH